ncbi:hypothetical protein CIRG_09894 [Coccidioides immitis RMSCC 2394]|uniref:Uncharacterized protein n=1 Tax=Coccidioides immitis RMSCC 2394 TaxID=404692 RepID=A0A0J6YTA1_COCIT|nr:hypothetical protein CIRG_09894 [Coccidioides immitis RMSCC 2394]
MGLDPVRHWSSIAGDSSQECGTIYIRAFPLVHPSQNILPLYISLNVRMMSFHFWAFWSIFCYRYVRLIVNLWAYHRLKPIPPCGPLKPADVTVVVPCLNIDRQKLAETLKSILNNGPRKLILVTVREEQGVAEEVMGMVRPCGVELQVATVQKYGKRRQLVAGIQLVATDITVLADDDVIWESPHLLKWILAPFKREKMGGVGTCQRLQHDPVQSMWPRLWSFLGALYLERRNFDCAATAYMDGGTPCMSGRTAAYRSEILQNPEFLDAFGAETWQGKQLQPDDDNFITRWLDWHSWGMHFQYHREALVLTTLEDNWEYLKQCLRWSRSNWRSNLRSLFCERFIWRRHAYSTYAVFLTTLSPPAFLVESALIWLCHRATENDPVAHRWSLQLLLLWMFLAKVIKFLGYFRRNPSDIALIPISILFGYFHGILKVYAACTLHVTSWGNREMPTKEPRLRNNDTPNQQGPDTFRSGLHSFDARERLTLWHKRITFFWTNAWPAGQPTLQLRLFGVGLCLLAERALNVLMPLRVGQMMSRLSKSSTFPEEIYHLAFLHFLEPGYLITSVRSHLLLPLEHYWHRRLKINTFARVMSLPSEFHEVWDPAALSDVISDVGSFETVISVTIFMFIPVLFDTILIFASIYYQLGSRAAVSFAAIMGSYIFLSGKLRSKQHNRWKLYRDSSRREKDACRGSISNWRTVICFGRLEQEITRFQHTVDARLNSSQRPAALSILRGALKFLVYTAGPAGCVMITHDISEVATVFIHLARLREPLESMQSFLDAIHLELAKVDSLIGISEKETLVNYRQQKVSVVNQESRHWSIEFKGVNFSYNEQCPVLEGLSFRVSGGETVAFVGESGSGKSTILNLLLQVHFPQRGSIQIDESDISESQKEGITFVPQSPSFFGDRSIMENLKYPNSNVEDAEIYKICCSLLIDDRIQQCPKGYNTRYQDTMFSGGEQQRLAIARALTRDARIFLLDELTNSQDNKTASCILDVLKSRANGTISGRLRTFIGSSFSIKGEWLSKGNMRNLFI